MVEKEKKTIKLDPIGDLFRNTWVIYKKTLLSYLKIFGVGVGIVLLGVLIGVLLALPLFLSTGGVVSRLYENPSGLEIIGLLLIILWLLASIIVLSVYSLIVPISYLFILTEKKRPSVKELYNKSKQYIVPYLLTSLFVGIAVVGGIVVLVIPGLVIALLFTFVLNVVVLENKQGVAALKRSYQLVTSHFWEIILRLLIIEVIVIVCGNILNAAAKEAEIFGLLSRVFSLFAEWFVIIYSFLIYQQVKETKYVEGKTNLLWVWIIAVVGWVTLMLLIGLVVSGVFTPNDVQTFADLVSASS